MTPSGQPNVVRGDHIVDEGGWSKFRLEGWVKGDVKAAVAAMLASPLREMVMPDVEPAGEVILDGLALFVDVSYYQGDELTEGVLPPGAALD